MAQHKHKNGENAPEWRKRAPEWRKCRREKAKRKNEKKNIKKPKNSLYSEKVFSLSKPPNSDSSKQLIGSGG